MGFPTPLHLELDKRSKNEMAPLWKYNVLLRLSYWIYGAFGHIQ